MCADNASDDWESNFFEQLGNNQEQGCNSEDSDNEDVIEMDVEQSSPKVKSFKEAILALIGRCQSVLGESWTYPSTWNVGISN